MTQLSFSGASKECAFNFCDNLELTCVLSRQDEEGMCKMFPHVLKAGAKSWYNGISKTIREDWSLLKQEFLK